MDLTSVWVKDPHTNQGSVSLTLVVLSAAILVVAIALEMTGITQSTSMAFEFFGSSSALYWGRKYTSAKGQVIASERE